VFEQVQFQPNIPQTFCFKYREPKECKNGSKMLTVIDGRVIFFEPEAAEQLARLGIEPDEPVQITRVPKMSGNRIVKSEWKFARPAATRPAPPQAAKPEGGAAQVRTPAGVQTQPNTNGNGLPKPNGNGLAVYTAAPRPATKLEDALKTVIAAVHAARIYAKEIGFEMPVFTAEDLRTMANTLMIDGRNGGLR
jgi:hypothetical protein